MSLIRIPVVITASGAESEEIPLENGYIPVALDMPGTFTGTSLTIQAKDKDGNWQDVYDDAGNQVSITVATDRWVVLSPIGEFAGLANIRFVSDATESADRTIGVALRVP